MDIQKYIIVKANRVVRKATPQQAPNAESAVAVLKPDRKAGETLYLEVVVRKSAP